MLLLYFKIKGVNQHTGDYLFIEKRDSGLVKPG